MSSIIHYLSIEKVAMHGYGIGFHEGKTVFVPYTMPGDCVNAQIRLEKKDIIFADAVEYIHTADISVNPACDAFGGDNACGGCDWLMAPYRTQLYWKTELIREVLHPLDKNIVIDSCLASPQPQFYRNKSFLPVGTDEQGRLCFGMFERYSHKVITHRQCLLQPAIIDEILSEIAAFANKVNIPVYDESNHSGVLRHVGIRTNQSGEEILVILVTKSAKLPFSNQLVRLMTDKFPSIVGIVQNINRHIGNVILGDEDKLLYGRDYLLDRLDSARYRVHYKSFLQINHGTMRLLYDRIKSLLKPDDIVLDAYCGIGSIGLYIAEKVKRVIGIEECAEAVSDAQFNKELNHIDNAEFQAGRVEDILPSLIENYPFSSVILDPPRKGVDSESLVALCAAQIPSVIYVSCNPMTLARDLRVILQKDYRIVSVTPFDMFPQTWHTETLVHLIKQEGNGKSS